MAALDLRLRDLVPGRAQYYCRRYNKSCTTCIYIYTPIFVNMHMYVYIYVSVYIYRSTLPPYCQGFWYVRSRGMSIINSTPTDNPPPPNNDQVSLNEGFSGASLGHILGVRLCVCEEGSIGLYQRKITNERLLGALADLAHALPILPGCPKSRASTGGELPRGGLKQAFHTLYLPVDRPLIGLTWPFHRLPLVNCPPEAPLKKLRAPTEDPGKASGPT